MSFFEIFLIGVGLSMDAFAVSICKGLSVSKIKLSHMLSAGIWFGGFQALMPLIGYLLGSSFAQYVQQVDHWIAFILLAIIGINMIKEAKEGSDNNQNSSFSVKTMFMLAVATSIDALAVGVTFAFLEVNIILSIGIIGITTFAFSVAGIKIGNIFGSKYSTISEIIGGIVLIIIGLKILMEGLFF